jgi:hypothetical protein
MRLEKYLITERTVKKGLGNKNDPDKIISPDAENRYAEDINEVGKLIRENCKPFLKESKGGILWRGMHNAPEAYEIRRTRTDRYPKDTPEHIHDAINDTFENMFGWRPRQEGVFCTGDTNFAGGYGTVVSIWPIGRIKYVWSDSVQDLYADAGLSDISGDIDDYYWQEEYDEQYGEGADGEWEYDGESTGEQDQGEAWSIAYGWEKNQWESENSEAMDMYTQLQDGDDEEVEEAEQWFESNGLDPDDYDEETIDQEITDIVDSNSFDWIPAIDYDAWYEDRMEMAQEDAEYRVEDYLNDFQDDDLKGAIESGNEITMGSKKYYIVRGTLTSAVWDVAHGPEEDKRQMKFDFAFKANPAKNKGLYNGQRFWAGLYEPRSMEIETIINFETAKSQNFRERNYLTPEQWKRWMQGHVIMFKIPFEQPKAGLPNISLEYHKINLKPFDQKKVRARLLKKIKIV